MELIIRDKIMRYFVENGLFSEKQFGFLKGRSTFVQLLHILDNWTELLEGGGQIDVVYTDLEKAFDMVPRGKLLSNLKIYSIHSDTLLSLHRIEAFLKSWKQRVSVNGTLSDWEDVLSGIPQGSVLGPLLFIMYINDLVNVCANMYLFVDDAKIYKHVNEAEDAKLCRLQHSLSTGQIAG